MSKIETLRAGVTYSPRPRFVATTLQEIQAIAQTILASGCYPKNCDNINKIVMMILAGNDIGLSPMQAMSSITPPVNGRCSLFGDMGLALVRASGQLETFDERIEGTGDARTAFVKIKRTGYGEKEFSYSIAQAKKLVSYRFANEVNPKTKLPGGGPWHDDPDNMLQWRARWRAWRSEFTDVLNGMGGSEEADDEDIVTVEATPTPMPQPPISSPSPPTLAAIAAGNTGPTEVQIAEITRLKKMYMPGFPVPEINQRWFEQIARFSATSARELTPQQADEFIVAVGMTCDPFTYPAPSM